MNTPPIAHTTWAERQWAIMVAAGYRYEADIKAMVSADGFKRYPVPPRERRIAQRLSNDAID